MKRCSCQEFGCECMVRIEDDQEICWLCEFSDHDYGEGDE